MSRDGGGVVGQVEIAWKAQASGELGSEVDLGGGEAERSGLGVAVRVASRPPMVPIGGDGSVGGGGEPRVM